MGPGPIKIPEWTENHFFLNFFPEYLPPLLLYPALGIIFYHETYWDE